MKPEQKAEAIRALTWSIIREHGVLNIMDDDWVGNHYLEDVLEIINS